MPEIWPVKRRLTAGIIPNVAPSAPCTKTEQEIVKIIAINSGQSESSRPIKIKPMPMPNIYTSITLRRLPNVSDKMPPSGRATRLTKANVEAIIPAAAAVRPQVSSKNIGSMEITANSAPKLAKYVTFKDATVENGYLSSSGIPLRSSGKLTRSVWMI